MSSTLADDVALKPPSPVPGEMPAVVAAPSRESAFRLFSIDALRGFTMFWLIGGKEVVLALVALTGWEGLRIYADRELEHPPWHGFHWYDLIMPLFMTVSGVTIPIALRRRLERGEGRLGLYWRVFRRLVLLVVLNVIVYGALQHLDWHRMRFVGVLTHIGTSYFFAAIIAMSVSPRRQIIWIAGILIGYWSAMTLIPVPDVGRGLITSEGHLSGFMDRQLLPGLIWGAVYDREGSFSSISAICTTLIGALAGQCLISKQSARRKVLTLLLAGLGCWLLAHALAPIIPFNSKVWSPSYVLVAGGWSLMLIAAFYLIIDVWGLRSWAFFFAVIGMNSITIYVAQGAIDFDGIANYFFAGAIAFARETYKPLLAAAAVLGVKWALLLFLYRRKIFLRA